MLTKKIDALRDKLNRLGGEVEVWIGDDQNFYTRITGSDFDHTFSNSMEIQSEIQDAVGDSFPFVQSSSVRPGMFWIALRPVKPEEA